MTKTRFQREFPPPFPLGEFLQPTPTGARALLHAYRKFTDRIVDTCEVLLDHQIDLKFLLLYHNEPMIMSPGQTTTPHPFFYIFDLHSTS